MTHTIGYPGYDILIKDIETAKNSYLYDTNGRKFVDLESGVWCMSIGHQHQRILKVINDQYLKIAHLGFNYSNRVVESAAREILTLLDFDQGKCVFLCSGSEAVEYGVRVAQMVIPRPLMMTMAESYFGAYGSAKNKTENEWYCFDWFECMHCSHAAECSDGCERFSKIPFKDLGGFLFEPGSSAGLVRFPPKKLIQNIERLIRANHGLVLVNEVTTGIGRTGAWFGYQHYDVSPDIVAMGKGIGNGYPVSVTAFHPKVINLLGDQTVMYAQSHQNDALGAAIAREVVQIIKDESLIEKSREASDLLKTGLRRIGATRKQIKEIRIRGLMCAIELKDGSDTAFTTSIYRSLVDKGYVLIQRPGTNVLRLDPCLTIDLKDIRGFLEVFDTLLSE